MLENWKHDYEIVNEVFFLNAFEVKNNTKFSTNKWI